jgi:hypothetical protein
MAWIEDLSGVFLILIPSSGLTLNRDPLCISLSRKDCDISFELAPVSIRVSSADIPEIWVSTTKTSALLLSRTWQLSPFAITAVTVEGLESLRVSLYDLRVLSVGETPNSESVFLVLVVGECVLYRLRLPNGTQCNRYRVFGNVSNEYSWSGKLMYWFVVFDMEAV